MTVVCPYCDRPAKLLTGLQLYPHRQDLADQKFWRCPPCEAHVGCHRPGAWVWVGGRRVTSDGTLPLGRLANAELRRAKHAAHEAFDPLWKPRRMTRQGAYVWLANRLGISVENCHIGMFDIDRCRAVVEAVREWRALTKSAGGRA